MIEIPKHGKLSSGIDNQGLLSYGYDPDRGFIGEDRAVFMAELGGKRYKVDVRLVVPYIADDKSPICPKNPQFIKVGSTPAQQA